MFDKLTKPDYSPNVVAPLIHSRMTMADMIAKENTFEEDGQKFLTLFYKSSVLSKTAEELITIPDQVDTTSVTLNTNGQQIPPGDSAQTSNFFEIALDASNGEKYDSILLKAGILDLSFIGDINHNARIKINIPNLKKNGQILRKTIYYNYSGTVPVIVKDTINMSGYNITFSPGNKLIVNFIVTMYGDLNPDTSPYTLNLAQSFKGVKFKKIFGYFGNVNFSFNEDSIDVNIFKNKLTGNIKFEDPRLHVYALNSLGMPIGITFSELKAHSSTNAPYQLSISGSGLPAPWIIAAPTIAQIGQSIPSTFSLTKSNSNIDQAINMAPTFFSCLANAQANPNGNPNTDKNFVFDTSKVKLDIEVELPLYGAAWDFIYNDTTDVNWGTDFNENNLKKIEWVLFKFNFLNGFPLDANLQMYLADSLGNKLDSILSPNEQLLASAIVGPSPTYRVVKPTGKYTIIKVGSEKIMKLANTKKLIFKYMLNTTNHGADIIKIYSDYYIDVKFGLQVQTKSVFK